MTCGSDKTKTKLPKEKLEDLPDPEKMADMTDEIDIKEDDIDIKVEIEPLLNSSSMMTMSIKSGFKDEFSDELEAETEDQDTENDDSNDVEEIVTDGVSLDDEQQFVDDSEIVADADLMEDQPDNDPLNVTEELVDSIEDEDIIGDEQGIKHENYLIISRILRKRCN